MNEIVSKLKELYESGKYKEVRMTALPYVLPANYENGGPQILMYQNLCMFISAFYDQDEELLQTCCDAIRTACLMFPNFDELKEYYIDYKTKIAEAYSLVVSTSVKACYKGLGNREDLKISCIFPSMRFLYAKYNFYTVGILSDVVEKKGFKVSEKKITEIDNQVKEIVLPIVNHKLSSDICEWCSDMWETIFQEYQRDHLSPNKQMVSSLVNKVVYGGISLSSTVLNAMFLNEDKTDIDPSRTNGEIEISKLHIYLNIISEALTTYGVNGKKLYFFNGTARTDAIRDFDKYSALLKKLSPEEEIPQRPEENPSTQISSGGCYVATCVYGSYDCPQVWTLRRYRDNTLASTWYGRAFIHMYYAISPTIVKWFGNTEWFKEMWKGKLDHMVKNLQSNGIESTPYEDKNWKR
ncbi:MAG: hypothetical protein KBS52_06710 [Clostridiales bacterium]|nr:hypothetical protein [Candidatus Equinaster intestinalis]